MKLLNIMVLFFLKFAYYQAGDMHKILGCFYKILHRRNAMQLTVNDLLCFDNLKNLRLIAGSGGTGRTVSKCGILDYEMEADLKGKYMDTNFLPGELVLSSLLFAKSNPFLIRDAIKDLSSRGGSGLIIKNVLHLPIHDSILRYADAKDFPILFIDDMQIYFEDLIIQIDQCLRSAVRLDIAEEQLDRLLYEKLNTAEKKAVARQLLPTLRDQYLALVLQSAESVSDDLLQELSEAIRPLLPPFHRLFLYRRGVMLLLSADTLSVEDCYDAAKLLASRFHPSYVGLSNIHFSLSSIDQALWQAIHAAAVHRLTQLEGTEKNKPFFHYQEIGIYRLLLPLIDEDILPQYADSILEPLIEFDAENRGSLMETLLGLVRCGGDLHLLAQRMGQHENTLRKRLEKIRTLTGLNYRKSAHYEELAIAAHIFLLRSSGV